MTSTDDSTVRLTGRRGLLAAIPSMLGFHPQESLVMVCLTGPRRRLGPVIRLDLEAPAGGSAACEQLRFIAGRHADEVALVCYTEQTRTPALVYDVADILAGSATAVLDVVLVGGGQVRTAVEVIGAAVQDDEDGNEEDGNEADTDDVQVRMMAAAAALHGRAVLPDREALRRSIAGPTGPSARRALAGMQTAADRLLEALGTDGPVDQAVLQQLTDRTLARAVAETTTADGVRSETAALLALLLCDVDIRDRVIVQAVRELDTPWVPMLVATARAIPDQDAAEVCAVLSVAAYRRGDGALAQVAADRALASQPEHRLSHLMVGVMAAGMPPAELADLAVDQSLSRGMDG